MPCPPTGYVFRRERRDPRFVFFVLGLIGFPCNMTKECASCCILRPHREGGVFPAAFYGEQPNKKGLGISGAKYLVYSWEKRRYVLINNVEPNGAECFRGRICPSAGGGATRVYRPPALLFIRAYICNCSMLSQAQLSKPPSDLSHHPRHAFHSAYSGTYR